MPLVKRFEDVQAWQQARGLITGFIRYLRNARVNGKAKALTQAPRNTGT